MPITRYLTLWITLLLALPAMVVAQCTGTDIRPSLTEAERAEIEEAVGSEPFAEGNFWQATRGGRTFTFIGTVHIDDPRLDGMLASVAPLIDGADTLFLEMTAREQAQLQNRIASDPGMILLSEGSLDALLPAQTWATLSKAAEARGLPAQMAARLQPWYLSIVLALPPCVLANGTPEGLDARIEARADAAGIPTQPLEPFDTLFALFARKTLDDQITFLSASVMEDEQSEDMLATTLNTFFEEAPAELWHMSRILARRQMLTLDLDPDAVFDELEQTLLIDRNIAWIDRLLEAPGDQVVAAFGAAHLFGEEGVLQLMANEGFEITRLRPVAQ
ncbi:MAG: TraB/GumN family protein [Marinovum sp.]|nr:TraB/GumN family protein [Marinovum sp.]